MALAARKWGIDPVNCRKALDPGSGWIASAAANRVSRPRVGLRRFDQISCRQSFEVFLDLRAQIDNLLASKRRM